MNSPWISPLTQIRSPKWFTKPDRPTAPSRIFTVFQNVNFVRSFTKDPTNILAVHLYNCIIVSNKIVNQYRLLNIETFSNEVLSPAARQDFALSDIQCKLRSRDRSTTPD